MLVALFVEVVCHERVQAPGAGPIAPCLFFLLNWQVDGVVGGKEASIIRCEPFAILIFDRRPDTGRGGYVQYDFANDILNIVAEDNPSAVRLLTSNTERMRFDTNGRALIGHTASVAVGGVEGAVQVFGTSTNAAAFNISRYSNDAGGPTITLGKSRGTIGAVNQVVSGDSLGTLAFAAADGTDFTAVGASIQATIDGTPGTSDIPGRYIFSTTRDGETSPTEHMRINQVGDVRIGTGSALATNATSGFLLIPGCPGPSIGVVANANTAAVALVFDTANNRLYASDNNRGGLARDKLTGYETRKYWRATTVLNYLMGGSLRNCVNAQFLEDPRNLGVATRKTGLTDYWTRCYLL